MTFRNRILNYGVKPADQFLAHPRNARLHPQFQRDAMSAALNEVGFVAPVLEAKSGYLVDGHERIWQALQNNNALVPYVTLDIDETEELYVLATFDPLTSLANYDTQMLDNLLQEVNSDSPAIQQMLSGLYSANISYEHTESGNSPDEQLDIYLNATIKQVVLLFSNEQYETVIPKLAAARNRESVETNTELFLKMLEIYESVTGAAD
jgi:hypothetical protein